MRIYVYTSGGTRGENPTVDEAFLVERIRIRYGVGSPRVKRGGKRPHIVYTRNGLSFRPAHFDAFARVVYSDVPLVREVYEGNGVPVFDIPDRKTGEIPGLD